MPLFTVQFSVLPAMPGTETRTLPPETAAVSDGEDAKSLCHKVALMLVMFLSGSDRLTLVTDISKHLLCRS